MSRAEGARRLAAVVLAGLAIVAGPAAGALADTPTSAPGQVVGAPTEAAPPTVPVLPDPGGSVPSPAASAEVQAPAAVPTPGPAPDPAPGPAQVPTPASVAAAAPATAQPAPGTLLPAGNWEVLVAVDGELRIAGWAFDPDQPTRASAVHVYVDGLGTALVADHSRLDVGAAFPQAGPAHGFSAALAATRGQHTACVYAIDLEVPHRNTPLGCRSIGLGVSPPVGNWEVLTASAGTVTLAGWALDPDRPTASSQVHVYVDGVGAALVADGPRPDVAAVVEGAGAAHGFQHSVTVRPGAHRVCAYAIDVDEPSRNTPFGCRTVATQVTLPSANWEVMSADGATITVAGWSLDPDHVSTSTQVHVYVDGGGVALVADQSRPDVAAHFPGAGPAHGFGHSQAVRPGDHRVCVYAIDVDDPTRNTPLGCRVIATQVTLPLANWELLTASAGALTVSGWALDPDAPATPVEVHVYTDGVGQRLMADQERRDVGAVFPAAGVAHGFSGSVLVAPGPRTVCVYAIDADTPHRNTPLGCRTVVAPALTPEQAVDAAWARWGGPSGTLGSRVGPLETGLVGGGKRQRFDGGTVYWTAGTGARVVLRGPVTSGWIERSSEAGALGYPVDDTVCGLAVNGCRQMFQGGTLYTSASDQRAVVSGPIGAAWAAAGAENGPMGYPVADAICPYAGPSCTQRFSGGLYAYTPQTGAHYVDHQVARVWNMYGAQGGQFGYPVADTARVAANWGHAVFQGGQIDVFCYVPGEGCTYQVAFG